MDLRTIVQPADIVLVADQFLTDDGRLFRGGAELHLDAVGRVLERSGHTIAVLQRFKEDRLLESGPSRTVVGVRGAKASLYWRAQRLARALQKRIHFNYIERVFPVIRAANQCTSGTFHGVEWDVPSLESIPKEYMHWLTRLKLARRIFKYSRIALQKYALVSGARILSVDSSLRRFAQQFVPSALERITVLPNFVDTSVFSRSGPRAPIPEALQGRRLVFFSRNFSLARGVPLLAEALQLMLKAGENVHLLVAGRSASLNPAISAFSIEARRRGLEERCSLLGSLNPPELATWYRSADVVILPSLFSEGTSLSCLEAMASETPVVATDVGGLQDLVIDNFTGRVCRPTAVSLAEAVIATLRDELGARWRAEQAAKMVATRHTIDVWTKGVKDFFNAGVASECA